MIYKTFNQLNGKTLKPGDTIIIDQTKIRMSSQGLNEGLYNALEEFGTNYYKLNIYDVDRRELATKYALILLGSNEGNSVIIDGKTYNLSRRFFRRKISNVNLKIYSNRVERRRIFSYEKYSGNKLKDILKTKRLPTFLNYNVYKRGNTGFRIGCTSFTWEQLKEAIKLMDKLKNQ